MKVAALYLAVLVAAGTTIAQQLLVDYPRVKVELESVRSADFNPRFQLNVKRTDDIYTVEAEDYHDGAFTHHSAWLGTRQAHIVLDLAVAPEGPYLPVDAQLATTIDSQTLTTEAAGSSRLAVEHFIVGDQLLDEVDLLFANLDREDYQVEAEAVQVQDPEAGLVTLSRVRLAVVDDQVEKADGTLASEWVYVGPTFWVSPNGTVRREGTDITLGSALVYEIGLDGGYTTLMPYTGTAETAARLAASQSFGSRISRWADSTVGSFDGWWFELSIVTRLFIISLLASTGTCAIFISLCALIADLCTTLCNRRVRYAIAEGEDSTRVEGSKAKDTLCQTAAPPSYEAAHVKVDVCQKAKV
ncbi:hypothetical protein IWQ60_000837 [Tieghemiomyces parasiticus]|uniref:Uncharacterized protein n=1 Tax=Tieghemiomyces parasiticus TaxID=78921 RepID=A0A9W8E328_9FUNG|nr:hypothetical protein IWQ60_000837 [Tieghemiomyces parasiticus]